MLMIIGLFFFGVGIAVFTIGGVQGKDVGVWVGLLFIPIGATFINTHLEKYVERLSGKLSSEPAQESPATESDAS